MGMLVHPPIRRGIEKMILEEATYEAYGYRPNDSQPKSRKLIVVACTLCGEFKVIEKYHYHTFCFSCSQLGNKKAQGYKHSLESRIKMSKAQRGNTKARGFKNRFRAYSF